MRRLHCLIEGRRRVVGLTLALAAQDQNITTIESSKGNSCIRCSSLYRSGCVPVRLLHPGQIMSRCLRQEGHATAMTTSAKYMSGNICRCGRLSEHRRGGEAGRACYLIEQKVKEHAPFAYQRQPMHRPR